MFILLKEDMLTSVKKITLQSTASKHSAIGSIIPHLLVLVPIKSRTIRSNVENVNCLSDRLLSGVINYK